MAVNGARKVSAAVKVGQNASREGGGRRVPLDATARDLAGLNTDIAGHGKHRSREVELGSRFFHARRGSKALARRGAEHRHDIIMFTAGHETVLSLSRHVDGNPLPHLALILYPATTLAPILRATKGETMRKVGVVGCGLMGSGIAEVCARQGLDVIVVERSVEALEGGRKRIQNSIERAVTNGKLEREAADAALSALRFEESLDTLADRDLVIEAVAEDEDIKTAVFAELDRIVTSPDAIFTTNTSSIPIIKLAMATKRPQQVIGMHFFNPVPVLKLVEMIPSLLSSSETAARVRSFAKDQLGKHVIVSPDRAGFVVNALLIPYLLSAVRMLESGFASAEDIDTGMVLGCAHPMGPLRLIDLIGVDTTVAIADSLYSEFKEQNFTAPPLLSRMSQAGLLGRKTGQGFYSYR